MAGTIGHVNGQTFSPGGFDSVQARESVWNEILATTSSGSSGKSDYVLRPAYGTGAAQNLTGYYSVRFVGVGARNGERLGEAPVPATYTAMVFLCCLDRSGVRRWRRGVVEI